jgi:hypothetical protein
MVSARHCTERVATVQLRNRISFLFTGPAREAAKAATMELQFCPHSAGPVAALHLLHKHVLVRSLVVRVSIS